MDYQTQALSSQHERSHFDCGVASLNQYIKKQASQDMRRRASPCFVFCEQGLVLGYYTLSAATVGLEDLPESWQRKLPRYPRVPATLMGRLAIDKAAHGKRLGELLLFDALFRALDASLSVASFAVVVDALEVDLDPLPFYEQYGFKRLSPNARTLFVPMATVAALPRKF